MEVCIFSSIPDAPLAKRWKVNGSLVIGVHQWKSSGFIWPSQAQDVPRINYWFLSLEELKIESLCFFVITWSHLYFASVTKKDGAEFVIKDPKIDQQFFISLGNIYLEMIKMKLKLPFDKLMIDWRAKLPL